MREALTEAERRDIRARREAGESVARIAVAYGKSERHVSLVQGVAPIASPRFEPVTGMSVTDSLEAFLGTLTLDESGRMRAEIARALAARLDRCGSRKAAGLAKQLAVAVSELERGDQKPDSSDELIARRRARHLAMTVEHNGA
jgi:hypothetical protein